MTSNLRCLIVGAGPSGLVAARYLKDVLSVTVVDCKEDIGGLWNYTELTDETTPDTDLFKSLYGHQHGSMYDNMLLNIPIEITHTEDFQACGSTSYPARIELFTYLKNYADKFELLPLIQLQTAVSNIDVLPDQSFNVTLKTVDGRERIEVFQKVVLATGHYSVPFIPPIPGQSSFSGKIWHSHNFRRIPTDKYANRSLLLVGGGSSSWDILKFAVAECPHIKEIVMSSRDKRHSFLAGITDPGFVELVERGKVRLVGEVERFEGGRVVYTTGESDTIDEVVFCTGYQFSFPFLPSIEVACDGEYVKDFYKGVFWLKNPNLAMIGAHRGVLFLKLELVGKWLARDFMKTQDVQAWKAALSLEESLLLQAGKPLSTIFAGIDSPKATEKYFSDLNLTYDQNYVEECERLFRLTRSNIQTHFFSYKTFRLTP